MSVLALTLLTDGFIALVVGGIPTWFAVSVARKRKHKGSGPWPLAAALWLLWALVVYAAFVEPRLLQVGRHDVIVAPSGTPLTRELKVALISDTHIGQFRHGSWLQTLVRRINALQPDVVVIAGDIASTLAGTEDFKPLRDLQAPMGAYAVLGNWDYRAGAVDVRKALGSQNVRLLVNRSVPLDVDGRIVSIIGLDDETYGQPDIDAASAEVPEGALRIVLSHNPDAVIATEAAGADLLLAGHTHCGQMRLPIVGAIPHLPIKISQKYDCGYFAVGQTRMFITPGVGESTARTRLFNPPEISFLRIRF